MAIETSATFDVGIVGGGPAGLSAAILLGRACRRVVVFDHGKPRNAAAVAVHGFLGLDGCSPNELRDRGRREAASYGVAIIDDHVVEASCVDDDGGGFELKLERGECLTVRKLLLATGVTDQLPAIAGVADFFGRGVHHCPYCDGWEHRDERLAALADGDSIVELAATLLGWSSQVMACTNGSPLAAAARQELTDLGIEIRTERISRVEGEGGRLERLIFDGGPPVSCDAVFFSGDQSQTSRLYESLGCKATDEGQIATGKKQCTDCHGLFVAGDADGDVQFAIVAAAEGAIAATAINAELIEDMRAATRTAVKH